MNAQGVKGKIDQTKVADFFENESSCLNVITGHVEQIMEERGAWFAIKKVRQSPKVNNSINGKNPEFRIIAIYYLVLVQLSCLLIICNLQFKLQFIQVPLATDIIRSDAFHKRFSSLKENIDLIQK